MARVFLIRPLIALPGLNGDRRGETIGFAHSRDLLLARSIPSLTTPPLVGFNTNEAFIGS
jgi:hypothetical protein